MKFSEYLNEASVKGLSFVAQAAKKQMDFDKKYYDGLVSLAKSGGLKVTGGVTMTKIFFEKKDGYIEIVQAMDGKYRAIHRDPKIKDIKLSREQVLSFIKMRVNR